jgi:transcriptional regulator with XRE-family HTH domain
MFTDRGRRGSSGGRRDGARDSVEYELERLRRELTTAVTLFMKDREDPLSKRELAERMKVTPGRVSQILAGDDNLTLRSLAAVSVALDAQFRVELVPSKSASDEAVFTFSEGRAPANGIETAPLPPLPLQAAAYPGRSR